MNLPSTPPPIKIWPSTRERDVKHHLARYRSGLYPDSSKILISLFHTYLLKWVRFLTIIKSKVKGARIDGPFRMFLQHYMLRYIPGDLESKHTLIVTSLKKYEPEDIYSEVCLAFLEACNKSENLTYGISHILAHRIIVLIRDPIVFGNRSETLYETYLDQQCELHRMEDCGILSLDGEYSTVEFEGTDTLDDFYHEILATKETIGISEDEDGINRISYMEDLITVVERDDGLVGISLNRDWIDGRTTGLGNIPEFSELTKEDRELILRYYIIKQKYEYISKDMGIKERRVRYLLSRAKGRLSDALSRTRRSFRHNQEQYEYTEYDDTPAPLL